MESISDVRMRNKKPGKITSDYLKKLAESQKYKAVDSFCGPGGISLGPILTTYGDPDSILPNLAHSYLMILDTAGNIIHEVKLPDRGTNGNGKGAPAAPTAMDLNGDGSMEIILQTFGAGCFVYTAPGFSENLLIWPTA